MPKYYYEIEQNTPEWDQIRLGKITGSRASLLLGKGQKSLLTATAKDYARRKAAEWITGQNPYRFSNQYTDRGHDLEHLAILEYQDRNFEEVAKVGFVEFSPFAGCSPDGLVDPKGGIEVKCFEQDAHLELIEKGRDAISKSTIAQIQFNMMVCECDWWDNVYYHPKFYDKSLLVFRFEPDLKMWDNFKAKIAAFQKEVERYIDLVLALQKAGVIEGENCPSCAGLGVVTGEFEDDIQPCKNCVQ